LAFYIHLKKINLFGDQFPVNLRSVSKTAKSYSVLFSDVSVVVASGEPVKSAVLPPSTSSRQAASALHEPSEEATQILQPATQGIAIHLYLSNGCTEYLNRYFLHIFYFSLQVKEDELAFHADTVHCVPFTCTIHHSDITVPVFSDKYLSSSFKQ
jgi:hypothetical protein